MAKPPRNYSSSGWYHVYNRGARRQDIFLSRADRLLFLRLLQAITEDGVLQCHAFCLMGNHYHLLVNAEDRRISVAMNRLMSEFVQKFNANHGFDGPLFRSRFSSTAIEDDSHLLETMRYIHNNPLDINEAVATYPWSSHRAYLGLERTPSWLKTTTVLAYFDEDIRAYQSFVEGTPYRLSVA